MQNILPYVITNIVLSFIFMLVLTMHDGYETLVIPTFQVPG
jgi:hypothetical protein